jgi:homoserine dehydrogenase
MIFDEEGLELSNWKDALISQGEQASISGFTDKMFKLNLQNSVFVDCTSNAEVVIAYEDVLKQSISIATPNKLASSGNIDLRCCYRQHSLHTKELESWNLYLHIAFGEWHSYSCLYKWIREP